ncbi:MAG: 4-hydroxy-tetrahydrodipicolinate synthase [Clostridia bacterium]|nr:4-hydroxy-tetrahydrodipicolinate synthase [Clostridia bacterium]
MNSPVFTGSGVALITPMQEDGSVNYKKLGELIEFQISNSTDALIICGTTGESKTLENEEHENVIKYSVEAASGRVPVIAGTGSNDTAYSVKLSKYAEKAGADALLLVTPYYNKATQKGLIKHFSAIASAAGLPCILYNVPSRTGMNIETDTYQKLSEIENIVAVKEASGNISQIAQIAQSCDLSIYSGNDDQIVPIMSLGGIGVISVLANILPRETHAICRYMLDGEFQRAREMQLKYLNFINALFCEVNPIPVKTALNLMGMNVGPLRLPLCEMNEQNLQTLKLRMSELELI